MSARATLSPNADIVARDLAVVLTASPGITGSRTFSIVDDGAATGVQCTVGGSSTTCNSGGATATIAAGSEIAIETTTGFFGANAADALIGWRATTP